MSIFVIFEINIWFRVHNKNNLIDGLDHLEAEPVLQLVQKIDGNN